MESRGAVNAYVPYQRGRLEPGPSGKGPLIYTPAPKPAGEPVFTINLANGTTPFLHIWDGKEYSSVCYRLGNVKVVAVTHGHYRPGREMFLTLDEATQDHVLNGGLLCEPLAVALARQMPGDDVEADWDYERFQVWCLEKYGRRRPPLAKASERS